MKHLNYMGFIGEVIYDEKDNMFYGRVINCKDRIDFKGKTFSKTQEEMKESVHYYLEFKEETKGK